MLHELTNIIPKDALTTAVFWLAVGVAIVGAVLWAVGVRFNRYLVTLLAVSAGALVGRLVPGWVGSSFDPMMTTIVGALLLGITGFILHRFWGAVGLAMVLGLWGLLGSWLWLARGVTITWNKIDSQTTLNAYLHNLWTSLPSDYTRIAPWVALSAALVGLAVGIVRWRIGAALLYSILGTTFMAAGALVAIEKARPGIKDSLPEKPVWQLVILGIVLALGFVLQWWQGGGPQRPAPASSEKSED